MAKITFQCNACEADLEVEESLAEQDITCSMCGRAMTVPRIRTAITVKGRADRTADAATSAGDSDDLAGLSDVNAFGDERLTKIRRRRRWAAVQQIAALFGILATVALVGFGAWRFYAAREAVKHRNAEELLRQKEAAELRRTQRNEAQRLSAGARSLTAYWQLTDNDSYLMWRALSQMHPESAEAHRKFAAWVEHDDALHGLFSRSFAAIRRPEDIEPACQRLAGLALGLSSGSALLPPLDEFRQMTRLKLTPE